MKEYRYKGFVIEFGLYGRVFSFQFCGDDIITDSLEGAKAIIDDILECECADALPEYV